MEFRHAKTGSMNIPLPSLLNGGPPPPLVVAGVTTALGRFDDARSSPGRQNTSHVPCKFFRAGACQAGNSCPFSHDPASTTDNICKYFAKGNCKFGPKCANIHVLPDGRRVNYTKPIAGAHLTVGGRVNTDHFHAHKSGSTLTNSFVRSNAVPPPYGRQLSSFREGSFPVRRQASVDISVSGIDGSYASLSGSYGDEDTYRYGLGLSPGGSKGLHVIEVPFLSSYESNPVSLVTRNSSTMASSVPSKIGSELLSKNSRARDGRSSETLKSLHYSVFGEENRERFASYVPPPPIQLTEEYLGKRALSLHRALKKTPKTASTFKAVDNDWEANFTFEEDYLPETLKDLMTPQEKARRGSRNADEEDRFLHSSLVTPNNEGSSRFSSPSNASPSRWGSLFQRQQQKEEEDHGRISAFGHVGSPLRNSSLNPSVSPKAGPIARPSGVGDSSHLSSSPSYISTSILSQQLQRTRLSQTESSISEPSLSSSRFGSNLAVTKPNLEDERRVSTSSTGTADTGRYLIPVDEDHSEFVFTMESDEALAKSWKQYGAEKSTYEAGTKNPRLGVIGSTAKIDSGATTTNGTGLKSMFSHV